MDIPVQDPQPKLQSQPVMPVENSQQKEYGGKGWRKKILGKNPKQNGIAAIILALIPLFLPITNIFSAGGVIFGIMGTYYAKQDNASTGTLVMNVLAIILGIAVFILTY